MSQAATEIPCPLLHIAPYYVNRKALTGEWKVLFGQNV